VECGAALSSVMRIDQIIYKGSSWFLQHEGKSEIVGENMLVATFQLQILPLQRTTVIKGLHIADVLT
jgi:hypothetical protein